MGPDGRLASPSCLRADVVPGDAWPGGPLMAQLGAIKDVAVAPDGSQVVVAAGRDNDGQLAVLARDPQSGALTAGPCLGDPPATASCGAARALDGP